MHRDSTAQAKDGEIEQERLLSGRIASMWVANFWISKGPHPGLNQGGRPLAHRSRPKTTVDFAAFLYANPAMLANKRAQIDGAPKN
jgi:hypothetical protein